MSHIDSELLTRLLNKAKLVDIIVQLSVLSTTDPVEYGSLLGRIERRLNYYEANNETHKGAR